MFDNLKLNELSLDDLESLKALVAETIKAKRAESKESAKLAKEAEKAARASNARSTKVGDIITFTMKGKEFTSKALKVTEKTVTVELDFDDVKGKRYIKFENILAVEPASAEAVA